MALFYSEKAAKQHAKKSAKTTACPPVTIQSLDYQGLGVAKIAGKTWFIENALPNEQVEIRILKKNANTGGLKRLKF